MLYSKTEVFMEEVVFELGLVAMACTGEIQQDVLIRKNISQGPEGGLGMTYGDTGLTTVKCHFTEW